ncbi:Pol polyprotein [Canna indica]|uniref:Pol polyprotein n=1 Tax=Canna indica TaxID=4628 RepID=A0AAQ3Q499_9LILI|nr:Pol polyprotein [Canna indica]
MSRDTGPKNCPKWLSYVAEAMIPVEIAESNFRRTTFEEQSNLKTCQSELDLNKEERELARIREEPMKLIKAQKYDKHVKLRSFIEGDLVLQKIKLQK